MTYEELDRLGRELTELVRGAATTDQVDELLHAKDLVNRAKAEARPGGSACLLT